MLNTMSSAGQWRQDLFTWDCTKGVTHASLVPIWIINSLISPDGYWKSSFSLRKSCFELLDLGVSAAHDPQHSIRYALTAHAPVYNIRLSLILQQRQRAT
jgi:hypothetical protein